MVYGSSMNRILPVSTLRIHISRGKLILIITNGIMIFPRISLGRKFRGWGTAFMLRSPYNVQIILLQKTVVINYCWFLFFDRYLKQVNTHNKSPLYKLLQGSHSQKNFCHQSLVEQVTGSGVVWMKVKSGIGTTIQGIEYLKQKNSDRAKREQI